MVSAIVIVGDVSQGWSWEMGVRKGPKNSVRWLGALAVGLGGLAWYLRGWQPFSDIDCARLTEPAPEEAGLLDAISSAQLRRDTVALSSIQPRNAGTQGEARAREWVAARFQEEGLRNVRFESIVYPRWVGESARLTLQDSPDTELPCLALSGSAATPSEGLRAPLIDVGGGQEPDYAQFSREQTQDRIHLAWGGSLFRRDICRNAGRAGATAVIVAHPDPRPVESPAGASHLVEAGTSMVLGRLPTLAVSHPIGQRLREAAGQGVEAWLSVDRRYTAGRGYNVVADLPGQTKEYITLVAHHDAWYSGAADNAAGVAAMLSLARAWLCPEGRMPRPRRGIRFVSTTAEEEGLMGSLADIVLRGLRIKARCRGVVSLDVVGARGETLWATGWPPQLCGAAVAIGRRLGYEAATRNPVSVYEGRAYGDHWPYTLLRIPGVLLGKFPYRYYHTPYDTPDRLNYKDARYHTAIAGTLAWRLAWA
jgi:aminopeptidase YwaD